jgi:multicomponent Na+:H+ antiporter subunit E
VYVPQSRNIIIEGAGEYSLRPRSWRSLLVQGIILMGMWLLMSGHYDVFHIALGVLSVLVVLLLNLHINSIQLFSRDVPEWERIQYGRVLAYIPWLLWQIVLSSLQVAYVVLHPRLPIKPTMLRFTTKLPNVGARVILGNSITLTPGTVTLEIQNEQFVVHALTDDSAAGLVDGTMPTKVAMLFRKTSENVVSNMEIVTTGKKV